MDKPKKARVDIFSILGGPSESDDVDDTSSSDLALKAAFKAVKNDDFDGFKEAMTEWMNECSGSESSDDDELDE